MEKLEIINVNRRIDAQKSVLSGSKFHQVMIDDWDLNDVSMKNCRIVNANLSDLEIAGAQLGGAFIHNVGVPAPGHPAYDPALNQQHIKFEDCNLTGTEITDCNLTGTKITDCNFTDVEIEDCNLSGMKINGILVDDLLKAYRN